jgi:hypothetical protein
MSVQPGKSKHTIGRVVARFVSGRDLDGGISRGRTTNATFIRRAGGPRADLTPHGRPSPWAHLPGYQRSVIRIASVAACMGAAYGYVQARHDLKIGIIAGIILFIVFTGWRAWRMFVIGRHNRRTVKPLYQTVAPIVGHPPGDTPHRFLTVPRKFRTMGNPVIRLELSPLWEGAVNDQKRVHGLVSRRLGGDWEAHWYHHVSPPRVEFSPRPQPPDTVSVADILRDMESAKTGILILGKGSGNETIRVNLDDESPHVAISAGTGGGKTAKLRLMIMQLKRQGCERIDIIDPKRVSHNWARGIPGVFIHRTMKEQMQAIRDFRTCMEARYDRLDANPDEVFPRRVLIIEEQNSFMAYANQYWDDARREADPSDRAKMGKRNPAIADLAFCLFQGRQACMNIISVYQRMSAGAAGGGDLRENYGAKILARFSPQTWKLLVGITPVPRSSRRNGRGIFVLGEDYRAVQFAYPREASEKDWPGQPRAAWRDEARDYATAGLDLAASGPDAAPAGMPLDGPDSPAPGPVTLREAVQSGSLPMRYGAACKARQRDPDFPAGEPSPAGRVYAPADLAAWHTSRTRDRRTRVA